MRDIISKTLMMAICVAVSLLACAIVAITLVLVASMAVVA